MHAIAARPMAAVWSILLAAAFFVWPAGTSAAEPPAREKGVVRMVFAGDIMLDGGPGHFITHGGDPFADVASILKSADLAVANLECAIATKGKAADKPFTFLGKKNSLPVLKKYFSAFSLANNHSCDWGKDGFLSQLDLFDQQKVPYFGGGRNSQDARRPLVLERNGRRIALLGYNDFPPRSFAAGPKTPGVAWAVEADMLADIKAARAAERADLVVVYLHWGTEEEPAPDESQRILGRKLIDAGADAVVGSHPHVTQTIDMYRGRPIIYSLGNFVFDYFPNDPAVWTGWIVELTFGKPTGFEMTTHAVELDPAGIPHLVPKSPVPKAK
jgi:poly-gamma-glutamate capsule biosynthesis protein CapA/YwtB (metallophosphatase superfamily)